MAIRPISDRVTATRTDPPVAVGSALAPVRQVSGRLKPAIGAIMDRDGATSGLFLLAIGVLLVQGKVLFAPVMVAILASFLFAPWVRRLEKLAIPKPIGAFLVLSLLAGTLGFGIYELSGPAAAWMKRLPEGIMDIEHKLKGLRHNVDSVNQAAQQVSIIANSSSTGSPIAVTMATSSTASSVMNVTGDVVTAIVITSITLFFLLSTGSSILDRAVRLIPGLLTQGDTTDLLMGSTPDPDTVQVLRTSERLVCVYLTTTVIINIILGTVLWFCFRCTGLPNPVLWGVVACILNFLPYVGPVIGIPLIALVSLLSFDHLGQAIVPPLLYLICSFIEGNIITPAIVGHRLSMSPIAVFLWMALWAWMWGAVGALIAVPMLVMLKEFCSQLERLRPFAQLIEP